MLAAEVLEPVRGAWRLPGTRLHRLVVWTFRRGGSNPAAWFPRQVRRCACAALDVLQSAPEPAMQRVLLPTLPCLPSTQLVLECAAEAVLQDWLQRIQAAIAQQARRQVQHPAGVPAPPALFAVALPWPGRREPIMHAPASSGTHPIPPAGRAACWCLSTRLAARGAGAASGRRWCAPSSTRPASRCTRCRRSTAATRARCSPVRVCGGAPGGMGRRHTACAPPCRGVRPASVATQHPCHLTRRAPLCPARHARHPPTRAIPPS